MIMHLYLQRNIAAVIWVFAQQICIFVSQGQLLDHTPEDFVKGSSANLLAFIALMTSLYQMHVLENALKNLKNAKPAAETDGLLKAQGMERVKYSSASGTHVVSISVLISLAFFIACFKTLSPKHFNVAVAIILGIFQLGISIYHAFPGFTCDNDSKLIGNDTDLESGLPVLAQKQLVHFSWLYYFTLSATPNLLVLANIFLFNHKNIGAIITSGIFTILSNGLSATLLTLPPKPFNLRADRFTRLLAVVFAGIGVAGVAYKGFSDTAVALLILSAITGTAAPLVSIRCCDQIEYVEPAASTTGARAGAGAAK